MTRPDEVRACLVVANTRTDAYGVVRKDLGAHRISFIVIDEKVTEQKRVIIGRRCARAKPLAATVVLTTLPNAEVLAITKDS